jgi:hypothetical protein
MTLIIEIAFGIVLGVFLLGAIAKGIAHFEDWREWKSRCRALTRRTEEAEKQGFAYNPDSVVPFEEQLNDWFRYGAKKSERTWKILCDTDTLFHNIDRHRDEQKASQELTALGTLLALREKSALIMYRSRPMRAEVARTNNEAQRTKLENDYSSLDQPPRDEALLGFSYLTDHTGTFIANPMLSDILDGELYRGLIDRGFSAGDAHHLTHAVGNSCDFFLTRDERIINDRLWLQGRFPGLKIRRPSELVDELSSHD